MAAEEAVDTTTEKKDESKPEPPPKIEERIEAKVEAKAETKSEPPPPSSSSAASASEGPVVLVEDSSKRKKKKKAVEIAIRITRVTKRFGHKVAVDDVSLKIKAGSVYGLIGPNGAGKTTTFSMLAGFLKPTEGTIEILGYSPDQVDELRSRIGVLPQDALLPPADKVGEFLMHMARLQDVPREEVANAAKDVLAEVDGRDWWNVRCSALSHGMAKRVQLAQALLGDPEVVLLDEPTAGLDPRVAYEVRQLIKTRRGRCTLIVSSHNLQELEEVCDGAAILDRGRVVAHGSMTELTAASEEVRIKVASRMENGTMRRGLQTVPVELLRQIPNVTRVELDDERSEVIVFFERKAVDAETVIGQVLGVLLQQHVRISGVSKGRGLEQRVMELT